MAVRRIAIALIAIIAVGGWAAIELLISAIHLVVDLVRLI